MGIDLEKRRQNRREYYRKNKQKWAKYYQDHKDEIERKKSAYYEANRERFSATWKAYRESHKEEIAAYLKDYGRRHADRLSAYRKEWRLKNSEWLVEAKKIYYEQNRETIINRVSGWQRSNKEKVNRKNRKWMRAERLNAIRAFGGKCVLCQYDSNPEILQFDHKVPIKTQKRPFTHREAMRNPDALQLLCPNCHQKKTRKDFAKSSVTVSAIRARERRRKALELFGTKCGSCSFADPECLQLDHRTPQFKMGVWNNTKTEFQALKNPGLFQCLCANCHAKKTLQEVRVDEGSL